MRMGISGSVIINKANIIGGNPIRHSQIISSNQYNPYQNQVDNVSSQNNSQPASPNIHKNAEEQKLQNNFTQKYYNEDTFKKQNIQSNRHVVNANFTANKPASAKNDSLKRSNPETIVNFQRNNSHMPVNNT